MATGHVPRCLLLPHRNAGRLHWGIAESIKLFDFAGGSSHYRSRNAYLDNNFDGIDAVLMRNS